MFTRIKMATDNNVQVSLENQIKEHAVMLFTKSACKYCIKVKTSLDSVNIYYAELQVNTKDNMEQILSVLQKICGHQTVPLVFINGKFFGGHDEIVKTHEQGKLLELVNRCFDYDLIIIGGGSGGLAASKQAAQLGKKVAVLDFVKPTPKGASWGLGGTCVNVGCIPKKLMHQTALLGKSIKDAHAFGWSIDIDSVKLSWGSMVASVQDYIGSLNWSYRVQLRDQKVNYVNSYAEFVDNHTIKATTRRGKETTMTADKFIICVGERPKYPNIPGAREYGITSDDLFSLGYCPGKTLVVGASYVALECAGFLKGLGLEVTLLVRSIFLRGFDQQMANKIGDYIENTENIEVLKRCIPLKVEEVSQGDPGLLNVTINNTETKEDFTREYNTVIFAIGRESVTKTMGLAQIGIKPNQNGKIAVNDYEQTVIPNIYSIGDNSEGRPELTPAAIQSGALLAKRLYSDLKEKCDYINVPTTVFTPVEYSCCGLSEEAAIANYGKDDLEVYHNNFCPLEWTVPNLEPNVCYAKVIANKKDDERIVGMHYFGPNAGEVMQGFAAAMKCGLTKGLLDATMGIHPTTAEIFTTLTVTKKSGKPIAKEGGC